MTIEKPAFKIKTGNLPLLHLHINTTDIAEFEKQLSLRLAQTPNFFNNTPLALDISAITEADAAIDFVELTTFMLNRQMFAAGVIGGSKSQQAAAVQAGLGVFSTATIRHPNSRASAPAKQAIEPDVTPEHAGLPPEPVAVSEADSKPIKPLPTLVIDKPVRTGQRVYAEGSNLVVLGVVNSGAELLADGDIHVYAPLRGRAIAGARDNAAARIFVHSMEAELLAIAGCFKVYEEGIPENVRGKPAQVRLEDTSLLIEPFTY